MLPRDKVPHLSIIVSDSIASPCYHETNAASVHNNIWIYCLAMLPRDKVLHLYCKSCHQKAVFTYFTVCHSCISIRFPTSMVACKQYDAHLCTIVPHCSNSNTKPQEGETLCHINFNATFIHFKESHMQILLHIMFILLISVHFLF